MTISQIRFPALAIFLIALFGSGCASMFGDKSPAQDPEFYVSEGEGDGWEAAAGTAVKPFGDSQGKKARGYFRKRGGRAKLDSQDTFRDPEKVLPAEVKAQVQQYVSYFTNRGRETVQRWLNRSHRYAPMMRRTFAEHGLPPDLVYLSMIESGFNPFAMSHARAVGIWQFIAGTGRRYNLKINRYVDERRDPEKATVAAAQYLRDLYEMFGSWDLALASYNAGEGKIGRGVRRYATDNFWEIKKTSYLRSETKNYVPQYLAALMIAKNPRKYGFNDLEPERPIRFEVVRVGGGISLSSVAKTLGVPREEMRLLNPELRRSMTPPGSNYALKVPPGGSKKVLARLAAIKAESREVSTGGTHRVRRGETLSSIAKRHGVSTRSLARANNMAVRDVLVSGKRLRIPGSGGEASSASVHVVRRGDTLGKIARRYGVSTHALARANNMRVSDVLKAGTSLRIPGRSEQASRTGGSNGKLAGMDTRVGETSGTAPTGYS